MDSRRKRQVVVLHCSPACQLEPIWGVFRTYEELPADTAAAAAERLREARDAGMRVSRVHVSWEELEPTPKSFDLECLVKALDIVPSSDAILLLIETVDSDDFSLPADLIDSGKPYRAEPGAAIR